MESKHKIRIRFEHGATIKGLVRETGFTRNTIRRIVKGESKEKYERESPAPKLGDFKEQLLGWLRVEEQLPRKQRCSSKKLYKRLKGIGYQGAYDSVQRFIRKYKNEPGLRQAFIPLCFAPGEAYQFDWSEETVELGGEIHKVDVAHFRLCYSRKSFMVAYPRQSQEMLFDAHIKAFAYFGGLCRRGIYDNLKTAVDLVFVGKGRYFNSRFLALMSHYLIEPTACTPAAGWEKGQVENQVQSMREDVFVPTLKVKDFNELNAILLAKGEAIAMERIHPECDKTIAEVFLEEKAFLGQLPPAFEGYIEKECRISSTCLIQFDHNRYSVDCHYASHLASVRIYAGEIVIVAQGKEIGRHQRLFGRKSVAYDPWHYVSLLERKPGALRNGAPFKGWELGISIETMRDKLVARSGGDREFVKILLSIKTHGLEVVTTACEIALSEGVIQSIYVLNTISRLRPDKKEIKVDVASHLDLKEEPLADCSRYNTLLREVQSCSI